MQLALGARLACKKGEARERRVRDTAAARNDAQRARVRGREVWVSAGEAVARMGLAWRARVFLVLT